MPEDRPDSTGKKLPVTSPDAGSRPELRGTEPAPLERRPVGGVTLARGGQAVAGTALEADVSVELAESVPTFGNVLKAIGHGAAASQTLLDQSVVDTVNTLANTKIDVVTDVVEELDDDGLPSADKTKLVIDSLSVLNFVTPTVHEWKHVAVSMDLEVGAMDTERGITFTQHQKRSGMTTTGLLWGFAGWATFNDSSSWQTTSDRQRNETAWSQGQVRLDAMLAPRHTTKFPVPAQVTIGPQMFFALGAVTDEKTGETLTGRSVDLLIQVRKYDGSVNPDAPVELDAGIFRPSFKSDGGFTGSITNPEGKIQVRLTRAIPSPAFAAPVSQVVSATLGNVRKSLRVTL